MKYKVEFSKRAKKQLEKLDKQIASLILGWIRKKLDGCSNPRIYGKSLLGDKSDLWRYRIGSYRLLCKIEDKKVTILILEVGHRKNIYN